MNERQKDNITDTCDEKDWRLDWRSDGCTIKTANGTRVEYQEDSDDRKVDIRAEGRLRTVIAVLRVLDDGRSIPREE
jgi:hypothetical protein